MSIRFACVCGNTLQVRDEAAGKGVRCPVCNQTVEVPGAVTLEAAEPEAESRRPRRRRPDDDDRSRRRRGNEDDDYDDRPGRPRAKSSTNLPLILGIVGGVLLLVVVCGGFLMFSAVSRVRDAARRVSSSNNLKMIGLALHNYHDANEHFPLQAIYSRKKKPLLSWRVAILPYVEELPLYRQFHLDEPWDSVHNKTLLSRMPRVYATPGLNNQVEGLTQYQAFVGRHTVITNARANPVKFLHIVDGASNTIVVGQAEAAVPWTKPEDMPFEPGGPVPRLDSKFADGFLVVFADGAVKRLAPNTPEPVLKALITRDGGERDPVDPWLK